MKKIKLTFLFFVFLFSACSNSEIIIDDKPKVNSEQLRVFVANSLETVAVPLPITIYVFDEAEDCIDMQTLQTAEEAFAFTLPLGNHTLYVISGASPDKYTLPAKSEATPDYPVSLKSAEKLHAELAAKSQAVTITNQGVSDLTITVDRVIAQITASISDVPDDVTAVSIALEPLENEILLNGSYGGDGDDIVSFDLVKTGEGLWKTSKPLFVLPGADDVTVTITLKDAGGSRPFAYTTPIPVKANSKTDITAAYKAGSAAISGKIQCGDWNKEFQVSFEFGEGANNAPSGEMLTQGDIYKGCYILDVLSESTVKSTLLLMAPQSFSNLTLANYENYLTKNTFAGFEDWQLLTQSQAQILYDLSRQFDAFNAILTEAGITAMSKNSKYIFSNAGNLEYYDSDNATFKKATVISSDRFVMRMVKAVEVTW